jgi:hypothetical protein
LGMRKRVTLTLYLKSYDLLLFQLQKYHRLHPTAQSFRIVPVRTCRSYWSDQTFSFECKYKVKKFDGSQIITSRRLSQVYISGPLAAPIEGV